jgi:hypothetical protein
LTTPSAHSQFPSQAPAFDSIHLDQNFVALHQNLHGIKGGANYPGQSGFLNAPKHRHEVRESTSKISDGGMPTNAFLMETEKTELPTGRLGRNIPTRANFVRVRKVVDKPPKRKEYQHWG